ncbi:hypothetical protein BDV97DRAFT_402015 [Delphinella strobiligena]|nr:hypothetical protein BDV97DRAFT_402015 [Delphinella strobiligena]
MDSQPPIRTRPESMLARNFSEDLDSLFGMHSGTTIGHLNETVQEKRQTLTTQERELAELEERIREAEERLARASASSPTSETDVSPVVSSNTTSSTHQASAGAQAQPAPKQPGYVAASRRPPNNRAESSFNPPMPGAVPITPEPRFEAREYVTVDRTR